MKPGIKICSKCKEGLPFCMLGTARKRKDGLRSCCNPCRKKYEKSYPVSKEKNQKRLCCSCKLNKRYKTTGYCENCFYNRYAHTCMQCEKPFKSGSKKSSFCSTKCSRVHCSLKAKVLFTCLECKSGFEANASYLTSGRGKYCSKNCYKIAIRKPKWDTEKALYLWGKGLSASAISTQIGLGNHTVINFLRRENLFETRPLKGESNPAWKGGVTPIHLSIRSSKEYAIWRKAVFERDGYTCVTCYAKKVPLNADHIKPFAFFPELRLDINNGRTLCVPCHKKTDTYAGKAKKHNYVT